MAAFKEDKPQRAVFIRPPLVSRLLESHGQARFSSGGQGHKVRTPGGVIHWGPLLSPSCTATLGPPLTGTQCNLTLPHVAGAPRVRHSHTVVSEPLSTWASGRNKCKTARSAGSGHCSAQRMWAEKSSPEHGQHPDTQTHSVGSSGALGRELRPTMEPWATHATPRQATERLGGFPAPPPLLIPAAELRDQKDTDKCQHGFPWGRTQKGWKRGLNCNSGVLGAFKTSGSRK